MILQQPIRDPCYDRGVSEGARFTEFQVSVGQVDYYKSLLAEADLEPEIEEHLRELISQKNYFGVEELLKGQNLGDKPFQGFLRAALRCRFSQESGKSKKAHLQSGSTFCSKTTGRNL